jgi:hypothetical protein
METTVLMFAAFAAPAPEFSAFDPPAAVVAPSDPSQPAPAGWQWQRKEDSPWQLVRVAAREVSQPAPSFTERGQPHPEHPFTTGTAAGGVITSPTTAAPPGRYGGTRAAPTYTLAPRAVHGGSTSNCPPGSFG